MMGLVEVGRRARCWAWVWAWAREWAWERAMRPLP
jgi:hypothetical protein